MRHDLIDGGLDMLLNAGAKIKRYDFAKDGQVLQLRLGIKRRDLRLNFLGGWTLLIQQGL